MNKDATTSLILLLTLTATIAGFPVLVNTNVTLGIFSALTGIQLITLFFMLLRSFRRLLPMNSNRSRQLDI